MGTSFYQDRKYEVGQRLLTLRARTRLTQTDLASLVGVNRRSIQNWEAGVAYPKEDRLQRLIAVFLEQNAFTPGSEREEAESLWQQVSQDAPRPLALFDSAWFDRLKGQALGDKRQTESGDAAPWPAEPPQARERSAAFTLPFLPTPLMGRTTELAEIARLLRHPACRLLTLVGPGGIGKTRLALEVAAGQVGAFSDGVAFVSLVSVGAPSQIISAIGAALQLSFAGQSDPTTRLLDELRERQMLLVLDNFEHLLEGAELISTILARAPKVTLLITSRERLNLQAEWLFNVEGLAYPPKDTPGSPALPEFEYSAVQLFLQRARQVQPELPLSETNLAAIVRICQHVAGMPLAIELAAAGLRLLPLAEIEQQIQSNLDVLTTALRDVPARHRSLRAVFDHSWHLLNEAEQAVFSRLAIFRGGWDQAAAEGICGLVTEPKAEGQAEENTWPLAHTFSPALLASLLDKSLVRRINPETKAGTEPRYVLLGPIREYALEKLVARGEAVVLQRAHAAYFLGLAEAALAQWDSPASDAAILQIDREVDNLRAALQWAGSGGDSTIGLQLAGALWRFWRRRGYIAEGRAWLEQLLAQGDDTSGLSAMSARLRALHGAAWLASYQHDFGHAARLFEQSMTLRRALGETEGETSLLDNAARAWRAVGEYGRATPLMEDALARHRALGDRGSLSAGGLGFSLYELGLVLREQGDFATATTLFEECIALHRELGDREGLGFGLLALSDVARDQGDAAGVRRYGEESLAILRELEVQWAIGFALNNLALAAYVENNLTQALAFINESVGLYRAQKADASLAEVLVTQGHLWRAQGDMAAAREALTEALRLAGVVGPRLMVAAALEGLAGVLVLQGRAAPAVRLFSAAAGLRMRMGTPVRPVDQPALERALSTAHAILSDAAFAREWQTAADLPLEQILGPLAQAASISTGAASLQGQPVNQDAPYSLALFNAASFERTTGQVLAGGEPQPLPRLRPPTAASRPALLDWGEAIDVPTLYGRDSELATLQQWVLTERCRVVALLGLGGIGKTSLALTLAHAVTSHFEAVFFRSLRNAPPLSSVLDDLIRAVSNQQAVLPDSVPDKIALFIEWLRKRRCLLVLDNLETMMQESVRANYADYGMLIQRLGESAHQSCLLLTSREKPGEFGPLEGRTAPVRTMAVTGLGEPACQAILEDKDIHGEAADWAALAHLYGGNPLALKLVAEPIRELFGGGIAAFLAAGDPFFNGVGKLLDQQISRLDAIEQDVLNWLAISREPMGVAELRARTTLPIGQREQLQALEALRRRYLIERGESGATFTLQPVVMEYMTSQLIERLLAEIVAGTPDTFRRYAVLLAESPEYVRQSQERVIVQPLLAQLEDSLKTRSMVESHLTQMLAAIGRLPRVEQGYGGGNVLNLLVQLGNDLRGYDFSNLNVWQANLADVELPEVNFQGADLTGSRFTEAFKTIVPVAFSPDGLRLAAGSIDGEVLLWRVADHQQVRLFQGHTGPVNSVAFSPDNRLLASGSSDGTIIIWSLANGARLATLSEHSSRVWSVVFSPDGMRLVSGSDDQTIKLWSVTNGTCLATLSGHNAPVASVAFSPDGLRLASGSHGPEPMIKCWEVATGECTATLSGHTADIWSVAFSPDGTVLASGSADLTLKLWSVTNEAVLATLYGHTARIRSVAWSPDGTTLVSGSLDQTVKVWDIAGLRLRPGQAAIHADAASGVCRATLTENTGPVNGVAFSPDGDTVAGGGELQTIALWSAARRECLALLYGYNSGVLALEFSSDGTTLASAGFERTIRLWSAADRNMRARLTGHTGAIYALAFSPDGTLLASGSGGDDCTVRLWSVAHATCLATFAEHRRPVTAVAWSADSFTIASGGLGRTIKLWSPTSPASLATLRGHNDAVRALAFSPDGKLLASASYDRTVRLWDVDWREAIQTLSGHTAPVRAVIFSPDGRLVASGSADQTIRLWSVEEGICLAILGEHKGEVVSLAFNGDGTRLVSGSFDGTVRLWDTVKAVEGDVPLLATLDPQSGVVYALAFNQDGNTFASGGAEGLITFWDLPTRQPVATLRSEAPYTGMNITAVSGLTDAQRVTLRILGAIEMG